MITLRSSNSLKKKLVIRFKFLTTYCVVMIICSVGRLWQLCIADKSVSKVRVETQRTILWIEAINVVCFRITTDVWSGIYLVRDVVRLRLIISLPCLYILANNLARIITRI